MIRRSLVVLALFAAVAAHADEPLAARLTVYRRPLPYVNGVLLTPAPVSVKLTQPANGWGKTIEEIRASISPRRTNSGAAIAELTTTTVSPEGTQVFSAAAGGAVSLARTPAGMAITLPSAQKAIVVPAERGTTVFAGKDEMVYLAISLMPPSDLDPPTVVINGISPPELLKRVDPTTPQAAKDAHVSGMVLLQARIQPDGSVSDAAVLSTPRDDFAAAAIDALKQWKFAPTTRLNGQPAIAYLNVSLAFSPN